MTEKRLIDANEVICGMEEIMKSPWYNDDKMTRPVKKETLGIVKDLCVGKAKTVDAVPVVRCKDCKNRGTPYSCPMRKMVIPDNGPGSYEDCTEDDGFCHMGAKRDGGADDGADRD